MSDLNHKRKIFDVSRPGQAAANPSSKPILISNRPEIEDPMVSGRSDTVPSATEKEAKTQLNPSIAEAPSESSVEVVNNQERVEVKESLLPKKKKTNMAIVSLLIILIIIVLVHFLINLGVISPSLNNLKSL
jgi:hypothetical protein